ADAGEAGSLTRRRGEAAVAAAAEPSAREDCLRAGAREIDDEVAVRIEDLRPHRDRQIDTLAVGAVLAGAAASPPAPALELALAAEARQVAQVRFCDKDDVAAAAAVPAAGAAFRDVLLAPKAQRAVAAAPRLHVNAGAVVEHGRPSR